MSDRPAMASDCICTFAQRLVGDGCHVCNPKYAEEMMDMASEDVVCEHNRDVTLFCAECEPRPWAIHRHIESLAAEVRELRKDRERLDWLARQGVDGWDPPYRNDDTGTWMLHSDDTTIGPAPTIRDAIDAAMDEAKGE